MKLSIVLPTDQIGLDAPAHTGDFEKNVVAVAGFGYDGVELALGEPGEVDAQAVKAIVDSHGLEIPAIGTAHAPGESIPTFVDLDPGVRGEAVQRIRDLVDFAAHFDATVNLGLIRGSVQPGWERAAAVGHFLDCLGDCCMYARRRGVGLVIEPINRYETNLFPTVKDVLELVSSAGSDVVGVLFNTFHANIEESSIENAILRCVDSLKHVHIADSNRWAPGDGHLDFQSIIKTLAKVGYDGYLSVEILPLPTPDGSARRAIRFLRPLL